MKQRISLSTQTAKERSYLVKLNIYKSTIIRVLSVGINFLLVPIMINYLNSELYGVWMVLLSILSWITFFDLGLGNGLKNRLAEALSKEDIKKAKEYIITTYGIVIILVIGFIGVVYLVMPYINWQEIFNYTIISNEEFRQVTWVTILIILLNFILSIYRILFEAVQSSSTIGSGQLLSSLITLIIILILSKVVSGSLLVMALAYGAGIILSGIAMTFLFFKKYSYLMPRLADFNKSEIHSVTGLSIQFFIIQLTSLIIFTTDNMIITQVLGPDEVTAYTTILKLFSIVNLGYGIILTPLWSAYTEAYSRQDFRWIRETLKKMNLLLIPTTIGIVGLGILCRPITTLWIGKELGYTNVLIEVTCIYTLVSVWNNIYAYFINGVGEVKLYMWTALGGAIINIPISIYLAGELGSAGVLIGSIVSLLPSSIQAPLATGKLLRGKENYNEDCI